MNINLDTKTLGHHLFELSFEKGISDAVVEVISRESFNKCSTSLVEIVKCKLGSGQIVSLFVKYTSGQGYHKFDHREGLEYEAKIYDEIIRNISLSKIKFYGTCKLLENNETLMALEYLEGGSSLKGNSNSDAFFKASEWIGSFHAGSNNNLPDFTKVYNVAYYKGWVDRALAYWSLTNLYPWLKDLANYFIENIYILTETGQTVIHGEYYSSNILIRDGVIYPIDWESAAIGPGEIDLSCLIEGRKVDVVNSIVQKYIANRWQSEKYNVEAFNQRLIMSQMYLHFRFLLPKRRRKGMDMRKWRFSQLHDLGKEMGII